MSAFQRPAPLPSIRRLPAYLRVLRAARERGVLSTSCTRIAEELGLQSVQVRKDLALTGVTGRPKVGYQIDDLIHELEKFLGWDHKTSAFLFGVGNLGAAILKYPGFVVDGLKIVEIFDVNPQLIGTEVCGFVVHAPEEAPQYARKYFEEKGRKIEMGIVTVPRDAAQDVAKLLVAADIRAVWNYAPAILEVPKSFICENVKLSESFAILTHRIKSRNEEDASRQSR